jgi:hypothetical protein
MTFEGSRNEDAQNFDNPQLTHKGISLILASPIGFPGQCGFPKAPT